MHEIEKRKKMKINFRVDKTFCFSFCLIFCQVHPLNDRKWGISSGNLLGKLQETTTTRQFPKILTGTSAYHLLFRG